MALLADGSVAVPSTVMRMYFAPTEDRDGLEVLLRDEGLWLLRRHCIGRVGFDVDGQPLLLPVNYAVAGETIVFRTGPGSKLTAIANRAVAFEVDHIDPDDRAGWSVLALGVAREIVDRSEIAALRALPLAPLAPWNGGEPAHWIGIDADTVTGRRVDGSAVRSGRWR